MFELFDQFLYIAILMFGAYITLYIKSRSYSGILLIACSILSNILLFSVVLDPFIFITLPITAVLLLKDFSDDFRAGIVSRKHKLGALLAATIIVYDFIFILQVANFNLANSYSLFTVGSIIGTITGFYLVIYPFKEMMEERTQNLASIKSGTDPQLETSAKPAISDAQGNPASASLMEALDSQSELSTDQTSEPDRPKQIGTESKIFGIDSLYVLVGGVVLLVLIGSIVFDLATRTVLDMEDYVFVTVEPNTLENAKVDYYASFEHFDKNNFYDQLIEDGSEYGLSDEQIELYTPIYSAENAEMFKKLDINVALDKQTVNNGDIVTTNITYNEKYALKHNIVLKNTNFETEINSLPTLLTSIDDVNSKQLKADSKQNLENSELAANYNLTVEPSYSYISEDGYINVILTYSGDVKSGILNSGDEQVSFKLTPYLSDDELKFKDEIKIVDLEKLDVTEF